MSIKQKLHTLLVTSQYRKMKSRPVRAVNGIDAGTSIKKRWNVFQ